MRWTLRTARPRRLPSITCVVRPSLSPLDRLRTAISENRMREDFTQADRVAALDALQALVEDAGLRGAGRALGISAGWLARQLSCGTMLYCSQRSKLGRCHLPKPMRFAGLQRTCAGRW
jgi:hypothetical protein